MALPVLLQAGIPALIKALAEGLKAVPSPIAQGAAAALDDVGQALGRGDMTPEQMNSLHAHLEKIADMESRERQSAQHEVNESLRVEVASNDAYVRRMRPTFGYIIAVTWAAQMLALAYVIVFDTQHAAMVIEAVQSLGTIWAVGLSVLGIYVYKRSDEKRAASPPPLNSPAVSSAVSSAPARRYNP